MYHYDSQLQDQTSMDTPSPVDQDPELIDEADPDNSSTSNDTLIMTTELSNKKTGGLLPKFMSEFIHIIQFCHLCAKGKMPPVLYSLASSPEIRNWFSTLSLACLPVPRHGPKRNSSTDSSDSDSENIPSPNQKMSRKDHYLIHTMLKLHETMDQNYLKQTLEKEEKEPGFNRLEPHRKNLILNASATPPFDTQASKPTDFYTTFLSKKSQFKAKEMMLHRFHLDKVAFNPSSSFIANLWNSDFFWVLPDSPSGISIFFCPEMKSVNAIELEKEKNFALADKVKSGDIEKLSKQKLYLPPSLMDMVWMTQNLLAVISLCFGNKSLSATFLQDWADHMYENRLMYTSLQASDNSFFAKVLFAVDNALQIHWHSCSTAMDRLSVNDRVLLMSDVQESILRHNFVQQIPKYISDKIAAIHDGSRDGKFQGGGKFQGKYGYGQDPHKGKQEIITDNDKNHATWHVKWGEDFAKVFYKNQKLCPKTHDGKTICMKYFLRGFCDKSCTRVHKLTPDDEKAFGHFVCSCREGAAKPDF